MAKLQLVLDRDRMYLYPWYFADECLTADLREVAGEEMTKVLLEFKRGHLWYYADVEKLDDLGRKLFTRIRKDQNFSRRVKREVARRSAALMNYCQRLPTKKFDHLSSQQLYQLYDGYVLRLKRLRAWGWVPPLIDGLHRFFLSEYLLENFKKFLEQKGLAWKAAAYYATLSAAEAMSEVQQEELDRLKVLATLQKNAPNFLRRLKSNRVEEIMAQLERQPPTVAGLIGRHAEKYRWLPYAYIGPGLTPAGVMLLMRESLQDALSIQRQIRRIKNYFRRLPEQKRQLRKKLRLPRELRHLFEISAWYLHLKDFRKGIYQQSYVMMDPLIAELARRLHLSVPQTKYLTTEELQQALRGKGNFRRRAAARTRYCVAVVQNGTTIVYEGRRARQLVRRITQRERFTRRQQIAGMTAYPGKVRGRVRVISVAADVPTMEPGGIMVSPATNPDLIVAMRRAGAIVTDTGGITCHAAIVSREMRKPCLIGTKIATKVLRDGDLVEVDATGGVVKILSSKSSRKTEDLR